MNYGGIDYEAMLKEYMRDIVDRDYCKFLYITSDNNPLRWAWTIASDSRRSLVTAHEALDELRLKIFRYIDEEEDEDRRQARSALGTWVTTFVHLINPNFEPQEVWGGNGNVDTWGFNGFDDRVTACLERAPEPMRTELLQRAAVGNCWWAESRHERARSPVWIWDDDR